MGGTRTAITVGNFDGVHVAHRRLVERARAVADHVIVLAFDPHPSGVLRPGSEPVRLTPFERRRELLLGAGADEVHCLEPSRELLGLDPEAFVHAHLIARGASVVVEGEDFRFGRGRAGSIDTLHALGQQCGLGVEVVPAVGVALADQSTVRASSTIVRWLLAQGRVEDAAAVLGRPHDLDGVVERGERLGRTIGFPTINIRPDEPRPPLPADGVYAGVAWLPAGRRVPAAISLGTKPSIASRASPRVLEAHLLDVERSGDAIAGLDEYAWRVRLEFHAWIREQARFASLDVLVDRIREDVERARAILASDAALPRWVGEVHA